MKRKLIVCSLILISFVTYFIVSYDNKEVMQVSNLDNNLNDIAFYIQKEEGSEEYNSVDTIPSKDDGYVFKEAVCNDNSEVSFNNYLWRLEVSNMEQGKVRCKLYFDIDDAIARKYILSLNIVNESTPDFSKTATTDEGIFTAEDDYGTSYYWRGAVTNNYFYFAGYYWRIIRINGDGTLRLIYQGTDANATGEGTQIGTSVFNSLYNDNAYVGFKYTSGSVHGTGTNSIILTALNSWYSSNLSSYTDKIDENAGFCGDRTPSTSNTTSNNQGGTGTTETYYGTYIRLETNKQPTFECENDNDLYTTSGSSSGNKALQYPIGLITADEVAYAGGVNEVSNSGYYLYTGQNYWTMSPSFYSSYGYMFVVDFDGLLNNLRYVNYSFGVRPVINLRSDVTLTGSGTTTDPYVVEGAE